MRFTHIDINFDVRYEGHQNCPKILPMDILRVFSDHHMWHQNWHQCVNLIVEVDKKTNWHDEVHTHWHQFWCQIWRSSKSQKYFLWTFWGFLVTIICDIKIDINVWTSMCQFIVFVNLLHSLGVRFFDIWHLFDNLTSFDIPTHYLACTPLSMSLKPLYPIAHYAPLPMCPIPLYTIAPRAPLPMCPIPLYPIAHVPHTPVPHCPCAPYPCTP